MSIMCFAKRYKKIATAILVSMLVCLVAFTLIACDPDLKTDEAIAIAKNDFGCEKVLWIETGALILSAQPGEEKTPNKMRSHYAYYVVGEKNGKEVYIVIPSDPSLEKAYIATWNLNYTFKQIVEKFNEHGANYVADVPDDYYKSNRNYINLRSFKESFEYYLDGDDFEEFYNRLDVKVAFEYRWQDGETFHSGIVTQENGELKYYEKQEAV